MQVLPSFSALGLSASRLFQTVKSHVNDVTEGPAVKFLETVVTQISDATDQVDEFLTCMALPEEGDENIPQACAQQLPVSNNVAPTLEHPSDNVASEQPASMDGWGDFGFDSIEVLSRALSGVWHI
jgi:hypothetical protein